MSGGGVRITKTKFDELGSFTLESKLNDARFFELGLHILEYTFA
ncbi:MAG: hypothetical protein J07HQX50_00461 [Haloquadratum sp. J07HQX50]|nr:MAG: hypothetical protein J07HQX50_00461 [Haloquadratum sp. J07HQX50]